MHIIYIYIYKEREREREREHYVLFYIGYIAKHAAVMDSKHVANLVWAYACVDIRTRKGMIRLETLIELKFLNSSFSNSNFSIRGFRAQIYH